MKRKSNVTLVQKEHCRGRRTVLVHKFMRNLLRSVLSSIQSTPGGSSVQLQKHDMFRLRQPANDTAVL